MTYLVLARKWRPRSFDTLVGQDHVVRALTHALSTQRLHHAWLFTGTRGVGKTTLSRILAKSLNCHAGITATPCGECAACTEIDAGRFVDYIELDAASNRGVDEMTQLLEQAVYSPSSGRFKVYMIDEVHMLSGHAFNAMLKTLEEPPPHVKFILATTDPQKIPATVLSRCLQFNLKQMTSEAIISYLEMVLQQEQIQFDTPALRLLAQAASGSMRDALSLTDQAIAYSAGNLTLEAMQGMLGTINQDHLTSLLRALGSGDAVGVIRVADDLAMRGLSYSAALADVAVLLSRIAIEQRIPGSESNDDPLCEDIRALAASLHPDAVQLFYSVAVHSRQELSLAPDEYAGFVMACLRMLSLLPPAAMTPVPPPSDDERQALSSDAQGSNALPATQQTVAPAMPASGDGSAAKSTTIAQPEETAQANHAAQHIVEPATLAQTEEAAPANHAPQQVVAPATVVQPEEAAQASHAKQVEHATHVKQVGQGRQVSSGQKPVLDDVDAGKPVAPAVARPPQKVADEPVQDSGGQSSGDIPPWEDIPYADDSYDFVGSRDAGDDEFETLAVDADGIEAPVVEPDAGATLAKLAPEQQKTRAPRLKRMTAKDWPDLVQQLPLTGVAAQLARQSEWLGLQGDRICLRMAIPTLAETSARARFRTVLSEHFGTVVELDIEYGETGDGTAHAIEQAHLQKLQKQAERAAQNDPFVNVLISEFGGQLVSGSVRAVVG